MKVLVACEFSGIVRNAFQKLGNRASSCDLINSELPGYHFKEDVRGILHLGWDLMIAHPPCTYLASSGARWFKGREKEQQDAINFVLELMSAPINMICIENPIGVLSTKIRKPDQIIQPWMFGHGETKATCLWLKNLPKLIPTHVVEGRFPRIHKMGPSQNRSMNRSRTYTGIAEAMAEQWGKL